MRTIKFRAWDEEFVEMIYTPHCNPDNYNGDINFELNNNNNVKWMQFTGLTDKNGVEIYEGDIVRIIGLIFEVTTNDFTKEWVIDGMTGQERLGMAYKKCKVIGNIYENPELIEEAADE